MIPRQSELLAGHRAGGGASAPSADKPASVRVSEDFDVISFHLHEGCSSNYGLMIMLPLTCPSNEDQIRPPSESTGLFCII